MKKLLLAVLIVVFAVPAFAYEIALPGENNKVNLYGQVRMFGWYQNGNVNGKIQGGAANGSDFMYGMQGNSRFGVDLNVGKFFAKVETNFTGDGGDEGLANGFGFRLFYGGYKFDHGGTLTIGRQFTLAETMLAYDSLFDTDGGLGGYGALSVTRVSMIKYGIAGFEIALASLNPYYGNYSVLNSTSVADKILPMIEAAYNLNLAEGMVTGKVFASWAGVDTMINANVQGLGGQRSLIQTGTAGFLLKIKVAGLTITPSAFYSLNGGLLNKVKTASMGGSQALRPNSVRFDAKGHWNGVHDVSTYGIALQLNYKFSDLVAMNLGGGWESTSGSQFRTAKDKVATVDSYSVYLNAPLSVTKNIIIIPTVAYFAGMTDAITGAPFKNNVGTFIAGAQFRVIF